MSKHTQAPSASVSVEEWIAHYKARSQVLAEVMDAFEAQAKADAVRAQELEAARLLLPPPPVHVGPFRRFVSLLYRGVRKLLRSTHLWNGLKKTRLYRFLARHGIIYSVATGHR